MAMVELYLNESRATLTLKSVITSLLKCLAVLRRIRPSTTRKQKLRAWVSKMAPSLKILGSAN